MSDSRNLTETASPGLPIGAVERETGLSKEVLRMWERRYGFPTPGRDAQGDRIYPLDQVERLRLICRLMDRGFRPGRLLTADTNELQALVGNAADPMPLSHTHPDLHGLIEMITRRDTATLRTTLHARLIERGLRRFVAEVAAPLAESVGEAWFRGSLAIYEEHLFTEVMQEVLRKAIVESRSPLPPGPRVLLATLPNELHGVGLLMAEALMSLEGAHCFSLGLQLPLAEILAAAASQKADVVALSFSQAYPRQRAVEALGELRQKLPAQTELWAGGAGVARMRRAPPGVVVFRDMAAIGVQFARWRARLHQERNGPEADASVA